MNKLAIPLVAILLVSCAPLVIDTGLSAAPTAADSPASYPTAPLPSPLPPGGRIIVRSSSLTLVVDNPATTLASLEQAVADAGGLVVSASSYSYPESPGYASLSAKVPPEALADLRATAIALASAVQSDSAYSQDATAEYRLMRKRLGQLDRAEKHLWNLLTETKDRELAASLMLLRELILREQEGLNSQLLNYDDRATVASFDVTLNQPVSTSIILE
jgi:hypothetical protein